MNTYWLTPHKRRVLFEIAKGGTNKSIAEKLHVQSTTVEQHVSHMLLASRRADRHALAILFLTELATQDELEQWRQTDIVKRCTAAWAATSGLEARILRELETHPWAAVATLAQAIDVPAKDVKEYFDAIAVPCRTTVYTVRRVLYFVRMVSR